MNDIKEQPHSKAVRHQDDVEMWRESHSWKTGAYAAVTLLAVMTLIKMITG